MREPGKNLIKAWSRDYNEAPFYFDQKFDRGSRLIAWTDEPEILKAAFYGILDSMSAVLALKIKICTAQTDEGRPLWTNYEEKLARNIVSRIIRQNEDYVFSDGMHQLWIKDTETRRYLVFEDHGIFNLYFPLPSDDELFQSLGFQKNQSAAPIFSKPHFHCAVNNSEALEMRFVTEMGLKFASSSSD